MKDRRRFRKERTYEISILHEFLLMNIDGHREESLLVLHPIVLENQMEILMVIVVTMRVWIMIRHIVRASKFQLKKVVLTLMKQLVKLNLDVHGNNNIVHIYPRDFALWGIFYEVNNAKRHFLISHF